MYIMLNQICGYPQYSRRSLCLLNQNANPTLRLTTVSGDLPKRRSAIY